MEVLESEEITILHKQSGKVTVSKDIKKMRELATGIYGGIAEDRKSSKGQGK